MAEWIVKADSEEDVYYGHYALKPLVRCKDCVYFEYVIRSNGWGECALGVFGRNFVEEEWYCSSAERNEEVGGESREMNAKDRHLHDGK